MKKLIQIIFILFLFSCTETSTSNDTKSSNDAPVTSVNSAKLNDVLLQFCEASSMKDEKKMINLIYPGLFSKQLEKTAVQYLFVRQFQATERFSITNVQEEGEPELVYTFNNEKFYIQKYTSDVDIKLSNSSTVSFEDFAAQMLQNDSEANINREDQSVQFSEKRKILLISNQDGTYVLPEIFINDLKVEGLDKEELKTSFKNN